MLLKIKVVIFKGTVAVIFYEYLREFYNLRNERNENKSRNDFKYSMKNGNAYCNILTGRKPGNE